MGESPAMGPAKDTKLIGADGSVMGDSMGDQLGGIKVSSLV